VNTERIEIQPETIARLVQCGIKIMSRGQNFCLFVREGCLAMVPCEDGVFAGVGSTGLSLEEGLGYLITRDGEYYLEGNTFNLPARPDQVEKVQKFSADLKAALFPE